MGMPTRVLVLALALHRQFEMTNHVSSKHGRKLVPFALLVGLAAGAAGAVLLPHRDTVAQTRAPASPTNTMVHITKYGNDLHAVHMALASARAVQKAGGNVTLLLDLEGVRLADSRLVADVRMSSTDTSVRELYDAIVKAGGQVLVCAHCAAMAGVDTASMRPGARLVREDDLGKAIQAAGQIIDY